MLVVAVTGLGGVVLGRSEAPGSPQPRAVLDAARTSVSPMATISVTGSGTVQGIPDTVSFQVGVQSSAATAVTALSENNARVASLESTLGRHGVTGPEMQTSGLNINENTAHGVVTGFTVDDELDVTMHKLSEAGSAIDAAAQAVGNGIELYGISFSISNESRLLASARARAIKNARTEASQLASGAGAVLGGIVKVTDQENSNPGPIYGGAGLAFAATRVPIETGSQPVSVQVSVVYALLG
ncbi:MAG: SIMPL domain-containing protein [Acidimicrobiales bacterium]